MPSRRSRVILVVLAVLSVASLIWAFSVEYQKHRIAKAYEQARQEAQALATERVRLNQELGEARQTIEGQVGDITNLQHELKEVQSRLDETVVQLTSLQHNHNQLQERHASVVAQLSSLMAEKQQLEARLSSLKELKLAMRDVKRKIWRERFAAWRARSQALREADQERLASGNRGYVMRQGASTLGAGPRLHVHVLEPQSQ